jgi:hypothetical protein
VGVGVTQGVCEDRSSHFLSIFGFKVSGFILKQRGYGEETKLVLIICILIVLLMLLSTPLIRREVDRLHVLLL